MSKAVAAFISPHGLGHAARLTGILASLQTLDPELHFDIFTSVPRWFFSDSLNAPYTYHHLESDVGLIQKTPLNFDLDLTAQKLDRFLPFDPDAIEGLAKQLTRHSTRMILCDIAPMGIAAAKAAGLVSVLVENFTWDWIYEPYAATHPSLQRHMDYLNACFASADVHIQAEPICVPGTPDFRAGPVSRKPRTPKDAVRRQLGVPSGAKLVLITLGGIAYRREFENPLPDRTDVWFVIPGSSDAPEKNKNVLKLPLQSRFFHTDLINASDAVVGKAGYSTLAEVYHAGIPFGYIQRLSFRESPVLEAFIKTRMTGVPLTEEQFQTGQWADALIDLLTLPAVTRSEANGADEIATFIHNLPI